jgi:hypothetical protein
MEKNQSNLFLVFLFTYLETLAFATGFFYLLVLLFNDVIGIQSEDSWFGLIFGSGAAYFFFILIYVIAFFLPVYFADRKHIAMLTPVELFKRYMPVPGILTAVVVLFVVIASMAESEAPPALFTLNLVVASMTMYAGVFFFVMHFNRQPVAKRREE